MADTLRPEIAILLPMRTQSAEDSSRRIAKLLAGLAADAAARFRVVIGYDADDPVLSDSTVRAAITCPHPNVIDFVKLEPSKPFALCTAWNKLADIACRHSADLLLLFGDDVEILSAGWHREICEAFVDLQTRCGLSFGTGCVTARDETAPGWPVFPVVGRSHLNIFSALFPTGPRELVNEGGNDFLFELYRRFGLACSTRSVLLRNTAGGPTGGLTKAGAQRRYESVPIDWRGPLIEGWAQKLAAALPQARPVITIDVATPSGRARCDVLKKIQCVTVPEGMDARFVVVLDRPVEHLPAETVAELREMELADPRVRLRVNAVNRGASYSRTRAAEECLSQWLLYLDDDIEVTKGILTAYAASIRKNPNAGGFVGLTRLQFDGRLATIAIYLVQTTFFWHIAEWCFERRLPVPWGPSANLLLRWTPAIELDEDFPKVGGGEDIDLCIKAGGANGLILPAPEAMVVHPWWGGGRRAAMWRRIFHWGLGDALLVDKHPSHAFRAPPNIWEASLLWLLVSIPIYGSLSWTLLGLLFMWCGETIGGVCWVYGNNIEPRARGIKRFIGAIEATIPRNAHTLGHFVSHLRRGRVLNLTKRFDWFMGLIPCAQAIERGRSLYYAFFWTGALVLLYALKRSVFH